jgi:hypothetical protein
MLSARACSCKAAGFAVEAHPVPRAVVEAAGMRSVTNLIVRHRFGDGPTVALNAHGDVVPPGLGWRLGPYDATIEEGPHGPVMVGRGVAVSKSDFATYAWALLALKAAVAQGAALGGTVELHFTYDEETGGIVGPKWLLDARLTRPDAVIAAGFSYAVVTTQDGCLHLDVTVTGKQAHAALPASGVDALESRYHHPRCALPASGLAVADRVGNPRDRRADAQRRADRGRHRCQRGARSGHLSHRPPHHPGGGPGASGSGAARPDRHVGQRPCGHHRGREAAAPRRAAHPATRHGEDCRRDCAPR